MRKRIFTHNLLIYGSVFLYSFYSMGFVIATGCLHAVGIGIGTVHRWSWGQKLLRASGAMVAAGGVFFLWKAAA